MTFNIAVAGRLLPENGVRESVVGILARLLLSHHSGCGLGRSAHPEFFISAEVRIFAASALLDPRLE
ncbi:hypothetical protein QP150_18830 [Sphingomonas sp. 22L2VL55-3]